MLEALLFYLFAALAVVGGLMAALLPRIVHAVFSLLLCFLGVTGIYLLAGADFLAITQLVVYIGGVLFAGLLAAVMASTDFRVGGQEPADGTISAIGRLLLGDYIILFEFASILLLVALVGAAYLVRRERA
jgi:NADH-quinone oxidoreductase subunit J